MLARFSLCGFLLIGITMLSACAIPKLSNDLGEMPSSVVKKESESTNMKEPEVETKKDNSHSFINNTESVYVNDEVKLQITYNPNMVGIKSIYIPDLPKEDEHGPCTIFGQNHFLEDKEYIQKSNAGDECGAIAECGSPHTQTFCEIQKKGDSKGRMEIIESPNDGGWINVRYTFYEGNYKFTVWAYNSKCNEERSPCGSLQRWDGINKLISTKKIIEAYKNNTELKGILFNFDISKNEVVDFQKIFASFKNALNSIRISEKNIPVEQKIINQTQLNKPKDTGNEDTSPVITKADTNYIDDIFVNLSKEFLRRDPKIPLAPTIGYLIITSIVSHDESKIVYSEISDCIKEAYDDSNDYDYSFNFPACNWKYNMFVKNLQTGTQKRIYSYPDEDVSFFQNLQKLIVNEAKAGGCPLVHFPIAWSKNDQKVILQWGILTNCAPGGHIRYSTHTIDSAGGDLENLSTENPIFLNNYSRVIFIDESDQSPPECGPGWQMNSGKIVLKHIETGETAILIEEADSSYSSLEIDSNQTTLSYSVEKVKDVNGCSEVDSLVAKKTGSVQIPNKLGDELAYIKNESYEAYIKKIKHIGILSADDEYVWCGKDGRYSLEEGYGNQSQPLEGADPQTFTLIREAFGHYYFKDKTSLYFAGQYEGTNCKKMNGADMKTFQYLFGPFVRDASNVYLWGTPLMTVDADSFKIVKGIDNSDLILFDKTSVYHWTLDFPFILSLLEGADPNHIDEIKSAFDFDRVRVQ